MITLESIRREIERRQGKSTPPLEKHSIFSKIQEGFAKRRASKPWGVYGLFPSLAYSVPVALELIDRPRELVAEASINSTINNPLQGISNVGKAVLPEIFGEAERPASWRKNIEHYVPGFAKEHPTLTSIAGFGGDIALDPLNLIPIGAAKKVLNPKTAKMIEGLAKDFPEIVIQLQKSIAKPMVVGEVTSKKLLQGGAGDDIYTLIDRYFAYAKKGNFDNADALLPKIKELLPTLSPEKQTNLMSEIRLAMEKGGAKRLRTDKGLAEQGLKGVPERIGEEEQLLKNRVNPDKFENVGNIKTKQGDIIKGSVDPNTIPRGLPGGRAKDLTTAEVLARQEELSNKGFNKPVETPSTIGKIDEIRQAETLKTPKMGITTTEQGLIEEAKKYKTVEEFVDSKKEQFVKEQRFEPQNENTIDKWYQAKQRQKIMGIGAERAEDLPRLTEMPSGIIEHIEKVPNGKIKLYRGVPENITNRALRYGDFLSPKRAKAQFYGKVDEFIVDPKDIRFLSGDELVYAKDIDKIAEPKTYSLTDIFNKAHAGETKTIISPNKPVSQLVKETPPIKQVGGGGLVPVGKQVNPPNLPPILPPKPPSPPQKLLPLPSDPEGFIPAFKRVLKTMMDLREKEFPMWEKSRASNVGKAFGKMREGGGVETTNKVYKALQGTAPRHPELAQELLKYQNEIETFIQSSKMATEAEAFKVIDSFRNLLKDGTLPEPKAIEYMENIFGRDFVKDLVRNRSGIADLFTSMLDVVRSIQTALIPDMSNVMIQNSPFSINHPVLSAKNILKTFPEMFSEAKFRKWYSDIPNHPYFAKVREIGVDLTDPDKISSGMLAKREEGTYFMNALEKIPVIRRVARIGTRLWHSYANKIRFDVAVQKIKSMEKLGLDFHRDRAAFNDIGKVINTLSGRPKLSDSGTLNTILANVFYSPKNYLAKLQMINPVFYKRLNPVARKMMLKEVGVFLGGSLALMLIAKEAIERQGKGKVPLDPTSSDFLKLRVNNRRYNIFGGMLPIARTLAQVIAGYKKDVDSGNKKKIQRWQQLEQTFLINKLAPIPGWFATYLRGYDIEWGEQLSPMIARDIIDVLKDGEVMEYFAVPPLTFFGVQINTYGNKQTSVFPTTQPTNQNAIKREIMRRAILKEIERRKQLK